MRTIIIEIWFHCEPPPLNINHKSHCPIDKRRRWLLYIFSSAAEEVKLWHTVVLRWWRREFHFPFNCYASLLLFLARGSGGFLPLGPWDSIEIACCHLKEHWTNQGSAYLWTKMGWHLLTLYRQRRSRGALGWHGIVKVYTLKYTMKILQNKLLLAILSLVAPKSVLSPSTDLHHPPLWWRIETDEENGA